MDTVLLVEGDEPLVRRVSWILQEAGYRVVRVARADDAPEQVAAVRPAVVVVNTALDAPAKTRLLDELHKSHPAPIIDLHDHARERHHPRGVPAEGFLHKPFDADSLVDLVNRLAKPGAATPRSP